MDAKAKADDALSILDALADKWAAECDLTTSIKDIVSPMQLNPTVPKEARAALTHRMEVAIDAMVKHAYKVGAYGAITGLQDERSAKRKLRRLATESQTESQGQRSQGRGRAASP